MKDTLEVVEIIAKRAQHELESNNIIRCWEILKEMRTYITAVLKEIKKGK